MDGVVVRGGGVEGEKTSQLRHVQLLNPPSARNSERRKKALDLISLHIKPQKEV